MGRPAGGTSVLQMPRIAFTPSKKDATTVATQPTTPPTHPQTPPTPTADSLWVTPALLHAPQTWPSASAHTAGLDNLGNTCFLNAALQCLLHCPPLAALLLLSNHSSHARPASFCAFCSLERLAAAVHSGARTVAPRQLATNCRALLSTFRVGQQEDAHEFVRALLEAMSRAELLGCGRPAARRVSLQRELSGSVHRVFGGLLQSSVTCTECRHVSCTLEPFLDLSLEISGVNSLPRALARFTAAESLGGDNKYRCDGCKRLVAATKRFSIRRAPNVLTLHLKRFDRSRKDTRHIQYPETLDLAPFMHGRPADTRASYTLSGVLIHQGGSRQYGHYFAYVKGSNGTWCLKDDSTSRTVPLSTALKQKAYVLFYTRVPAKTESLKKPVKPIAKPNVTTARTLAADMSPPPVSDTVAVAQKQSQQPMPNQSSPLKPSKQDPFPGAHLTNNANNPSMPESQKSSEDESYQPMSDSDDSSADGDPGISDSERTAALASMNPSTSALESRTIAMAGSTPEQPRKRVATAVPESSSSSSSFSSSDSEVDTEPSDPTLSSADDDESPSSGPVRTILIGGGDAVRKVIQRVFGVSQGTNGRTDRKKVTVDANGTPTPSSPKKGSPKQSRFGKRSPRSDTKNGDISVSADGKRASAESASSVGSSGSLERKGSPRTFRIGKRAGRSEGQSEEPPTSFGDMIKRKGSSSLFRSEGVDKWDNDAPQAANEGDERVRLQKRGRAEDALDAEYDRGKAKKVRQRSNNGSGGLHAWNVFDRAAEKRRSREGHGR